MSRKNINCYNEMLNELIKSSVDFSISLNQNRILSDFEIASVQFLKSFFPDAISKGCLQKEKLERNMEQTRSSHFKLEN